MLELNFGSVEEQNSLPQSQCMRIFVLNRSENFHFFTVNLTCS